MNPSHLFTFVSVTTLAGIFSWFATFALRRLAPRLGLFDIPNQRSSHGDLTPRGGGLSFVVVAPPLMAVAISLLRMVTSPEMWALLFGCLLVAAVSLADDRWHLPILVRFGAHVAGALILIAGAGWIREVQLPGKITLSLGMWGLPLTFLWIIGLTNAYNFMDGIDGIAGGQAVVAGLGWTIIGFMSGQTLVSLAGMILAASSLGFLFHNWPPARIFMGDVGSASIGFTLAGLPVIAAQRDPLSIIAGFLVVWPFIFDTSFTLIRRLARGENIFVAHRSHIYQRLVIAGYSHRFVTLVYIGLALIGTGLALLWYNKVPVVDAFVLVVPILLFAALWRFTVRAESRAHSGT